MSLDTLINRNDYDGDGLVSEFDYSFRITNKEHLTVFVRDLSNVESILELDIDYTVAGVGERNGGSITLLAGPLTSGFVITIMRVVPIKQGTDIKNQRDFYPEVHENVFDRSTMIDQQLQEQLDRSLKLPPTSKPGIIDMTLPAALGPNRTLVVGEDGLSFVLGPTTAELSDAALAASSALDSANAAALSAAEALASAEAAALSAIEAASSVIDDSDYSYEGYSARFGESFGPSTGLGDTLLRILNFTYTAPTISLSASGSGTIREKGTAVTASTLTANITKKSDPIATVRFYKGATLLDTQVSGGAIPSGGSSVYSWTGSFSDNTTFSAQVEDNGGTGGPTTVTSNSSFTFVYPYYFGVGAAGLSGAAIAGLTKDIRVSIATLAKSFTVSGSQYMYFAYPSSYGALTSILDVSNFETIGDWTRTTKTITGLDASGQSYYCYEFNNLAVAGTYSFTFKR